MMQKRNKPITIKIDTGDNPVHLPALLYALSQTAQKQPFLGRISYSVGRRGLLVSSPQIKAKQHE